MVWECCKQWTAADAGFVAGTGVSTAAVWLVLWVLVLL